MSFFDQHYFELNKLFMSQIGIWPEQPKYVRNILPLTIFVIIFTLICPQLIRLHEIRGDIDAVITALPQLLATPINIATVLNSILKTDKMKIMLNKMEAHWKMFENKPGVIVLEEYAERGRFLTSIYAKYIYISLFFYLCVPMMPVILDFVDPLNETRPKDYIHEAEYGFDRDEYFWFVLVHGYIVIIVCVAIFVAIDTMYIMWVQHCCALFEVIGFQLNMNINKFIDDKRNLITLNDDYEYKRICDCIFLHKEALSFAGMIENIYSGSLVIAIGISTIVMSITGLEMMINLNRPEIVIRSASFTLCQAFRLYLSNVPGQQLIDHSLRVQNSLYEMDWTNIPLKARKLLILIMIRSRKPCLLTAGKVYVLSMESYAMVMKTAASYFSILNQLY